MSRTGRMVLFTAFVVTRCTWAQTPEVTLTITKTPSGTPSLTDYGLQNVVPGIKYPEWFADQKLSAADRQHLVTLYNEREWLRFQDELEQQADPLKIQPILDLIGALGGALNPNASQVKDGNKDNGVTIKPRDGYEQDQPSDLETSTSSPIATIDKEIAWYSKMYDIPPSLVPDPNYRPTTIGPAPRATQPDAGTQLLPAATSTLLIAPKNYQCRFGPCTLEEWEGEQHQDWQQLQSLSNVMAMLASLSRPANTSSGMCGSGYVLNPAAMSALQAAPAAVAQGWNNWTPWRTGGTPSGSYIPFCIPANQKATAQNLSSNQRPAAPPQAVSQQTSSPSNCQPPIFVGTNIPASVLQANTSPGCPLGWSRGQTTAQLSTSGSNKQLMQPLLHGANQNVASRSAPAATPQPFSRNKTKPVVQRGVPGSGAPPARATNNGPQGHQPVEPAAARHANEPMHTESIAAQQGARDARPAPATVSSTPRAAARTTTAPGLSQSRTPAATTATRILGVDKRVQITQPMPHNDATGVRAFVPPPLPPVTPVPVHTAPPTIPRMEPTRVHVSAPPAVLHVAPISAPAYVPTPMPRIDPIPVHTYTPMPMPRIEPITVPAPVAMPHFEPMPVHTYIPTPMPQPVPMPHFEPVPVYVPPPMPRIEPIPMPRIEPVPMLSVPEHTASPSYTAPHVTPHTPPPPPPVHHK